MKPGIELIRIIAVILISFTHVRHELTEGSIYFMVVILPTYGTTVLSVISGYLYYSVSRQSRGLLIKKVKSLAVPFLIANFLVIGLTLIANYVFGYNALNRLSYGWDLFTEGFLSLNSPPINPPTYFVRDIFMVFVLIELITRKNFYTLFILIPYLIWGKLFIRFDIVLLFALGGLYAYFEKRTNKTIVLLAVVVMAFVTAFLNGYYLKYPMAFIVFLIFIDLKIPIYKTGRYSYLLHLYHSPIMVVSFPVLALFIHNWVVLIALQILIAIFIIYCLFLISKKWSWLTIITGGR
ncbi:MAG: acyltransferase family protein [Marinilabiliaceae bacterium]|nr:acyltransferase family protein [Marinilabiliaceae bacterium]